MNMRDNKFFLGAFGVLLAALFALAGCSDLGDPLRLFPRAEISVSRLDFGAVAVGSFAAQNVTIANSGDADLHGVAAVGCPEFALESGGGAYTVPPGGVHTVVVRYTPSAVGPAGCQLTLGDGLRAVDLAGSGTPAPAGLCVASVSSLDFGTLAVGASKLAVFKLYSRGTAPVDVDVASSCGELQLLGGNGAHTIPVGDSLVVTVQFAPGTGGHFACSITSGAGNPVVTVSGDATSVSFATQIVPIMNRNFCTIACHSVSFTSVSILVNVPSPGYAPAVRIKPFDLAGSVLYGKVTGTAYGSSMPFGSPLIPVADRNLIKTWILEGAHDN
jgi:hypothetical protein